MTSNSNKIILPIKIEINKYNNTTSKNTYYLSKQRYNQGTLLIELINPTTIEKNHHTYKTYIPKKAINIPQNRTRKTQNNKINILTINK